MKCPVFRLKRISKVRDGLFGSLTDHPFIHHKPIESTLSFSKMSWAYSLGQNGKVPK
jgi:hypothetical protein